MHRASSVARGQVEADALECPILQPEVQAPSALGPMSHATERVQSVFQLNLGFLKYRRSRERSTISQRALPSEEGARLIDALSWLGQTWPGLKELAHDIFEFLIHPFSGA
jgi:hypothetical protein